MPRGEKIESTSEDADEEKRIPQLGRSVSLVWAGGILLILGIIVAAAFTWINTTKGVLSYIADNESVRIFFVVIGGLVAVIGFVAGLAGRFGANNVLMLHELREDAKTMEGLVGRSKTRFTFRR